MRSQVEHYLRSALDLSRKGQGNTFPNPCVGALIVKDGKIVGRGFHKKAGTPHAEVIALKQAGRRARGGVLYCTLEPCVHWGRTGPCTESIIAAGIRRVFLCIKDPNPLVRGKGIRRLRTAGIKVRAGFLEKEAAALNASYIFAMRRRRPMVTAKIASSLDGKSATRRGISRWITDSISRQHAHRARGSFDAIMVGIGTVLADDPRLEAVPKKDHWTKVVVDSKGRLPLHARLLRTSGRVVVATAAMRRRKEEALRRRGVSVVRCPDLKGRVDGARLLKALHGFEVRHLLAEGGPTLIGSLFDRRLVDRVAFYLAPKIIGGAQALPAVGARGIGRPDEAPRLKNVSWQRLKSDFFVTADVVYPDQIHPERSSRTGRGASRSGFRPEGAGNREPRAKARAGLHLFAR